VANGQFKWPNHSAILQCPCCQKRAKPDEEKAQHKRASYVLGMHHIQQLLEQTRQQPMRCIYRLICFECFKRMLPDSWAEVVSDPALDPPPNAWRVVEEFDAAGGMQAYSNRFAKLHVEMVMGGKVSKSGTKANSGRIVARTRRCWVEDCEVKTGLQACAKCRSVHCARPPQPAAHFAAPRTCPAYALSFFCSF